MNRRGQGWAGLGLALAWLAGAPGSGSFGGEPAPAPSSARAPAALDYMIVVTGEELLRGVYPDAHTHFLTRTLFPLGCHCLGSITVDDDEADLKDALAQATRKAPLVIVTGGLGPTVNDVTRGAVSQFTGIPLQEQADLLAGLERRFKQPRDRLQANLRRQSLVPARGGYLPNPNGTAAGLIFEADARTIVALPGPPRELQPMAKNELIPYLRRRFSVHPPGSLLTLRFVGVGQSQIDQVLQDHSLLAPDIKVGSQFEGSRVDFTFALPGNGEADRARLRQIEAGLREHLGDGLYADDGSSLEEVVVARLRAASQSLALAELGSGGSVAASLAGIAGASEVLRGAWVAPTETRLRSLLGAGGASATVGAPPAGTEELAQAARELAGSDWIVATGAWDRDANPPAVWLVLGGPDGRWHREKLTLRDSGEVGRAGLTTQVLERLRRSLAGAGEPRKPQ